MVKVYCYEKCSTCKKALKWLDDNQVQYRAIDIKGDHPDEKTAYRNGVATENGILVRKPSWKTVAKPVVEAA